MTSHSLCVYRDVLFYGDDYVLEKGYPLDPAANSIIVSDILSGRKAKGRFYAECPNYEELTTVEVEFANIDDVVLVIKEE